ncbi:MAG: hypothetical protein DCF27_06075 [Lysobacteraceae bacterium]|nr:MAG: hypothetical protein DCF27_06075 [Xanthomonadaceae bacterium]
MAAQPSDQDTLTMGHFRPAAGHSEASYRCGATKVAARYETVLVDGIARKRVVTLSGARTLNAAEIAKVNALINGASIVGIGVACLGDSAQFTITTWARTNATLDAVLVMIGDNGELKLL